MPDEALHGQPGRHRTTISVTQVGVRGTPAIFSESGEYLGGYLPPATLSKRLDEEDDTATPGVGSNVPQ